MQQLQSECEQLNTIMADSCTWQCCRTSVKLNLMDPNDWKEENYVFCPWSCYFFFFEYIFVYMIWFWYDFNMIWFWLNPLRLSPWSGGRWIFYLKDLGNSVRAELCISRYSLFQCSPGKAAHHATGESLSHLGTVDPRALEADLLAVDQLEWVRSGQLEEVGRNSRWNGLEWMGWLPKTVAHANPSRIQMVGETHMRFHSARKGTGCFRHWPKQCLNLMLGLGIQIRMF